MTIQSEQKPSFGKRFLHGLGWLAKFLLRIVFVAIIGAGLGLILYVIAVFGVRLFNTELLDPIRDNSQRVENLEVFRANDMDIMNGNFSSLQEQITTLQTQGENHREQLDSIERRLGIAEGSVQDALGELESVQIDLDDLAKQGDKTTPRLEVVEASVGILEGNLESTLNDLIDIEKQIEELTIEIEDDTGYDALNNDVMILKAMQSLIRTRLFLTQNNTGLAVEEISAARDQLLIMQGMVPDYQTSTVLAIIQRLDLARDNLATTPEIATDDLEAAWQLLLLGLPSTPADVIVIGVPTTTLTSTLELTPSLPITLTEVLTTTNVITP